MTIKNNITWYPHQEDTIKGILTYPHDKHVIKASRQKGKSVMCESIILSFALNNQNSFNLFVSPTLKQSRKVYRELYKAVSGGTILSKANESLLELKFKSGGVIQFVSAEMGTSALQGYTVTGILIIDESAYIQDDIFYALLPTCDTNNAPVVLVSTPRYRKGFFYDNFVDGLNHQKGIHSYDWSKYDTSALLPPEKLEYYRQRLPNDLFKQYYLGEFCDLNANSIFGDYTKVVSNTFQTGLDCYCGIDWGTGSGRDDTAVVIFNTARQMIFLDHFNDCNELETIQRITRILKRYKPRKVLAETNSIGSVYLGLLRAEIGKEHLNIATTGFTTTNDSKLKIISGLQLGIQNQDIQLLDNEYLLTEFNMYESELTHSGKLTFNAKQGYHDDLVIATALAYSLTARASYNLM